MKPLLKVTLLTVILSHLVLSSWAYAITNVWTDYRTVVPYRSCIEADVVMVHVIRPDGTYDKSYTTNWINGPAEVRAKFKELYGKHMVMVYSHPISPPCGKLREALSQST